ncbi:LuxR C-terminal-related transcriptional regulator [Streptomyces sp. NPDC002814]
MISRLLTRGTVPAATSLADPTRREREAVTLVAQGLSTHQIADRMTISPRTRRPACGPSPHSAPAVAPNSSPTPTNPAWSPRATTGPGRRRPGTPVPRHVTDDGADSSQMPRATRRGARASEGEPA